MTGTPSSHLRIPKRICHALVLEGQHNWGLKTCRSCSILLQYNSTLPCVQAPRAIPPR